jgi:sulfhydrogenase subunit beta (sulfur reductase)
MNEKIFKKISKEKLREWLGSIKSGARVFSPKKVDGLWTYGEYTGEEVPLHFRNSRLSPKGLFLKSPAPLFGWKSSAVSSQILPALSSDRQRVIFGIRACDLRALFAVNKVFAGDEEDLFYSQNISRTVLLGAACRTECDGSFCREMGIDPQDSAEADIFFRETSEGYVARVNSERGLSLIREEFFAEAKEEEWVSSARAGIGEKEKLLFNRAKARAGVVERFADEEFWQRVSATCVNCGICTYLCPTCHCFDLCDQQIPGQGVRYRCWDSCAFPGFTKMAVHNPREEKWRRYRQRVSHKFNFFFENNQEIACVGCGRCVVNCPVNLDLREILQEAAR